MNLYTELRQTPKQKAKGIVAVSSIVRIPLASYSPADLRVHDIEHDAQTGFWNSVIRHDVLTKVELDELVAQFADHRRTTYSTKDRHWFIALAPMNIFVDGKTIRLTYKATAQSSARTMTAEVNIEFRGKLTVGFDTE